jgi:hypothetical protein
MLSVNYKRVTQDESKTEHVPLVYVHLLWKRGRYVVRKLYKVTQNQSKTEHVPLGVYVSSFWKRGSYVVRELYKVTSSCSENLSNLSSFRPTAPSNLLSSSLLGFKSIPESQLSSCFHLRPARSTGRVALDFFADDFPEPRGCLGGGSQRGNLSQSSS